jgi:hypothetical protein
MQGAICGTRRMHQQPFHFHCCSCFPIHSVNCAPFALLPQGFERPERERWVFLVLVRSLTNFFAPSNNHFGIFDEEAELISCIESN